MRRNIILNVLWAGLIYACVATILLTFVVPLNAQTRKQYWNWTEPGEHHKSIVIVRATYDYREKSGGTFGSGVYINYKGMHGILTARHTVTRRPQYIRIIDYLGRMTNPCRLISKTSDRIDLAFIKYYNKELTPLSIAESKPIPGQEYELVGWGGPGNDEKETNAIRHFWVTCIPTTTSSKNEYRGGICLGDSGGPILTKDHKVAGIVLQGYHPRSARWPSFKDCNSCFYSDMVKFLDRLQPVQASQNIPPDG